MATKSLAFVRGRVARLTRLDGCGRPVYGDASVVTTNGATTVGFTANIDEGTSVVVPNFAGENVINDVPVPRLTGYGVAISFARVDPDLFALATGQQTVLDADGNVVGFDVDPAINPADHGFALEVWAGAPAQVCTTDEATGSYGYLLLPFLQVGVLGDFTVENGAVTFALSNAATKEGNAWGRGPYDVVLGANGQPGPQLQPISTTLALRTMITEVAPPPPLIGARPLLHREATATTSVTAAESGAGSMTVTFTAVPTSTDPFWVDFGDGEWDYSPTGSPLAHTYEVAGSYTASLSRGASTRTLVVTPGP